MNEKRNQVRFTRDQIREILELISQAKAVFTGSDVVYTVRSSDIPQYLIVQGKVQKEDDFDVVKSDKQDTVER